MLRAINSQHPGSATLVSHSLFLNVSLGFNSLTVHLKQLSTMQNFNLIDHPWIPIRWTSSSGENPSLISLHDTFQRGEEIADLDCLPQERISLIRLLVCISHAAIGAPSFPNHWAGFGNDLAAKATAYLARPDIHPHFNLLGDGQRFLQEDVPDSSALVPASKLISSLATGNNPTLLDHYGMSSSRDFTAATIARALLTFQNFYPLYGAGYKGKGPCCESNALHTILLGKTLLGSIRSNMVDLQTMTTTGCQDLGKPIWECASPDEIQASTSTLLGRLVPRHRSLKIDDNLQGFFHRKDSLQYPGFEPYREPSVTTFTDAKDNRRILSARVSRGIWRDLHSLTLLDQSHDGTSPVLASHEDEFADETCTLWSGALITDLKAKILDTVESTFTVPSSLFEKGGYEVYEAGVGHAETISKKLYGAVKYYGSSLSHESPPTEQAQQHYWHALDQSHRTLIQLSAHPEEQTGKPAIGGEGAVDEWTLAVRSSALAAYQAVCPQTTPRQIQAFAAGIKPLYRTVVPKRQKTSAKRIITNKEIP